MNILLHLATLARISEPYPLPVWVWWALICTTHGLKSLILYLTFAAQHLRQKACC